MTTIKKKGDFTQVEQVLGCLISFDPQISCKARNFSILLATANALMFRNAQYFHVTIHFASIIFPSKAYAVLIMNNITAFFPNKDYLPAKVWYVRPGLLYNLKGG